MASITLKRPQLTSLLKFNIHNISIILACNIGFLLEIFYTLHWILCWLKLSISRKPIKRICVFCDIIWTDFVFNFFSYCLCTLRQERDNTCVGINPGVKRHGQAWQTYIIRAQNKSVKNTLFEQNKNKHQFLRNQDS